MCRNQELDVVVVGYQFVEQDKKAKLTLGRECGFGLVHQIEA
jgi:hypothetical protein